MAAGILIFPGRMPARDRNGRAAIGLIRVYQDNTTTPVAVYTDSGLGTARSQPITSDDAGNFPLMWIDSANTPVTLAYEGDDGQTQSISGVTPTSAAIAAALQAYSGAVTLAFSTTTADADPGTGTVRFNNATIDSVTSLYIDNAEAGGGSITGYLDAMDDANTGTARGTIVLRSTADATKFAIFTVTGAVTDGTGYRKVPVTYRSGALFSNAEAVSLSFSPAGPDGVADDGWSPVLAIVADGARRVLQVVDYAGGSGTEPTSPLYVGATGLTAVLASAVDIRGATGASGAGSGDLVSTANLSDVASAATSRVNLGFVSGLNALWTAVDAAAARTALGLGTAATKTAGTLNGNVLLLAADNTLPALSGVNLTGLPLLTLVTEAQSGAYTLVGADKDQLMRFTGASAATWAADACATLGDGWIVAVENGGTAPLLIDPNGSELIDNRTSIYVYPNEPRFWIQCDGTKLTTIGRAKRVLTETKSAAGLASVDLEAAFSDDEAATIDIELVAFTHGSTTLQGLVKQGGSYLTTTTYSYRYEVSAAVNNASGQSQWLINPTALTLNDGVLHFTAPQSTTASEPLVRGDLTAGANFARTSGWHSGAARWQGFRLILGSGGNFTTGTARAYINRD